MEQNKSSQLLSLTPAEELLRHNLEIRKYWSEKDQTSDQGLFPPFEKKLNKQSP